MVVAGFFRVTVWLFCDGLVYSPALWSELVVSKESRVLEERLSVGCSEPFRFLAVVIPG